MAWLLLIFLVLVKQLPLVPAAHILLAHKPGLWLGYYWSSWCWWSSCHWCLQPTFYLLTNQACGLAITDLLGACEAAATGACSPHSTCSQTRPVAWLLLIFLVLVKQLPLVPAAHILLAHKPGLWLGYCWSSWCWWSSCHWCLQPAFYLLTNRACGLAITDLLGAGEAAATGACSPHSTCSQTEPVAWLLLIFLVLVKQLPLVPAARIMLG